MATTGKPSSNLLIGDFHGVFHRDLLSEASQAIATALKFDKLRSALPTQ